jgi:hypothetical protein
MNAVGERMNPQTSKEINRRRRTSSSSSPFLNLFLLLMIIHSFLYLLVISIHEVSPVQTASSLLFTTSSSIVYKVSLSSVLPSLFASASPFSSSPASSSSSNPLLPSSFVFKIGEFLMCSCCFHVVFIIVVQRL